MQHPKQNKEIMLKSSGDPAFGFDKAPSNLMNLFILL